MLTSKSAKWLKCEGCGERIRPDEKHYDFRPNTKTAGKYCLGCLELGQENYAPEIDDDDDGERSLRQREAYAAYQAAGCTGAYWQDRDAGYCD